MKSNSIGKKGGPGGSKQGNSSAFLQAQITAMRQGGPGQSMPKQGQRNSQTMTQVQALQVSQTLVNQKHNQASSGQSVTAGNTLQIASPRQQQNQSMNVVSQNPGSLEVSQPPHHPSNLLLKFHTQRQTMNQSDNRYHHNMSGPDNRQTLNLSQGPILSNNGQNAKAIMSRRYNKVSMLYASSLNTVYMQRAQNQVGRGETQQMDAISYRLHQQEKNGFNTNDRSMLNVTVAGSSAVQQSNNSITAGLISNQPNELKSIEQAMASTSFFSPKVQNQNQSFGK